MKQATPSLVRPVFRGRTSPLPPIAAFVDGEVYLFHPSDERCPAEHSLWGIFDRICDGQILLESSSQDLRRFRWRHPLPDAYRFFRLATRDELRDYTVAAIWAEARTGCGGTR